MRCCLGGLVSAASILVGSSIWVVAEVVHILTQSALSPSVTMWVDIGQSVGVVILGLGVFMLIDYAYALHKHNS